MNHTQLMEAVQNLRTSSHFTSGDATTFAIPFLRGEAELPAPCDPYAYLTLLKAKLSLPDFEAEHRIAVIGAGLGGLTAAALDLGVDEVISIEPRPRFREGLDKVTGLLNEVHKETDRHKARCFYGWPTLAHLDTLGSFDMIIWPECFEEANLPVDALVVALKLLNPLGYLVIEIKTGFNENVPTSRTNSWLPTTAAFEKLVEQVNGQGALVSINGRAVNRTIYIIQAHEPKTPVLAPAPSTLPTFPRDPAARILHHVGLSAPAPTQPPAPPVSLPKPLPKPTTKLQAKPPKPVKPVDDIFIVLDDLPEK